MKKIRIIIYSIFAFIFSFAGISYAASISDFWEKLLNINIPLHTILSNSWISRYDLTRLLNATECKDCVVPNYDYINTYSNTFWNNFIKTPGKDFNDIVYWKTIYNKKNYYYCVAYVGDKWYMEWYPKATSPVCAGKFCGDRLTTKAEFLQVIINIISKYLYSSHSLNWDTANTWIKKLRSWSYEHRTFTKDELTIITKKAKECGKTSCSLQDIEEFNIYLKYCMFNLKSCGMIPFWKIKEGYWPVAELNILYRQNIISLNDAVKYNIGENIDGKLTIDILGRVNDLIWCSFNSDYDCDGISNTIDNCPYTFNAKQHDLDKDGIWNVCDDDIDGDDIKNPIGIVDDNNKINIKLWNPSTDNCLLTINTDQKSTIKDWIGDACLWTINNISLTIAIQKIQWTLPKTITFSALSKWNINSFHRDFGDGSIWSWTTVSHSYIIPWLYTVRLFAKWESTNDAYAKTTVIVWRDQDEKQGMFLLNTSLITPIDGEWNFTLSALGNHDSYQWMIWKTTITTKNPNLRKKFTEAGTFPISVKAIHNWSVVAATMFSLWVGDNYYWSLLIPSDILVNKYDTVVFDTKLSNFTSRSISSILWDFGDGTTKETVTTQTTHDYQSVWKKVVLQTIYLRDWTKLQNMVTLFVSAPNLFTSYWIQLLPSSLDISVLQKFSFSVIPLWDGFSDILFANIMPDESSFSTINLKTKTTFPFKQTYSYTNPWIYYPQTNLSLDQCSQLSAQATLSIWWEDFCLSAKLDGKLSSYIWDIDKDGIPDICDDDIDGDGVKNLLWIIQPGFPSKTNYSKELQNPDQDLIHTTILQQHFKWICSLDNDPFTQNIDQWDIDNNNIGDTFESLFDTTNILSSLIPIADKDWDSIVDNKDSCPIIPETWNWISDFDWCPELWLEFYCDNYRSPTYSPSLDTTIFPAESILPQNTLLPKWTVLVWGLIIPNDSILSQNITFPLGTILPGGAVFPDGTKYPKWTILQEAIVFPSGTLLPGGAVFPDGTILPEDTIFPDWATLPWGATLPSETNTWDNTTQINCGNWIEDIWENCQNCPQDVEECLFITTAPCLQCPCPFVDKNSSLTNKDIIKAVLRDHEKKYPWGYSLGVEISL